MQKKDLQRPISGLNTDDNPALMPAGDYPDALNVRVSSSDEQHGVGLVETLQGEIELLIGVTGEFLYYGEAIGSQFIYSGYEEVLIGSQVWMKKNWPANYPGNKVYDDFEANKDIYGALYKWDDIMQSDFAPDGWRIPTEADIDELLIFLGGAAIAGGKMKETGMDHFLVPNTSADDASGFRALPGGKYDGAFDLLQEIGLFWLQDDGAPLAPVALDATAILYTTFTAIWEASDGTDGYYLDVSEDDFATFVGIYNNLDVGQVNSAAVSGLTDETDYYYRVRAYNSIGTSDSSNTISLTTVALPAVLEDYDGNVYTSVIIGNQEWLVENLKTTHYADGTLIPNLIPDADWSAEDGTSGHDGGYCWYNNNIANKNPYGALYNWFAVNNAHGLAPIGWRIANDLDYRDLVIYVGGSETAGNKLKESGTIHWTSPNTGATNDYGYTVLPSGLRYYQSTFYSLHDIAFIWTPDSFSLDMVIAYQPQYDREDFESAITFKAVGGCVRCVRDI